MPLLFRLLILFLLLSLSACDYPKDMEGTSDDVRDATLVVGAFDPDTVTPRERRIAERLAGNFAAEIEWVNGDPHRLVADLDDGKVHIIAGELPKDSPFAADMALSRPVGQVTIGGKQKKTVLGVRKGENGFLMALNRVIGDTP